MNRNQGLVGSYHMFPVGYRLFNKSQRDISTADQFKNNIDLRILYYIKYVAGDISCGEIAVRVIPPATNLRDLNNAPGLSADFLAVT